MARLLLGKLGLKDPWRWRTFKYYSSAILAGPGPGAYKLPPTIGYEHHDNRKQRMPQYSFGQRTLIYGADAGPGPGGYQVDKLTRYGPYRSPEFTMGGLTKIIGESLLQLPQ